MRIRVPPNHPRDHLHDSLDLLEHCAGVYAPRDGASRHLGNRAFFGAIYIEDDGGIRAAQLCVFLGVRVGMFVFVFGGGKASARARFLGGVPGPLVWFRR